MGLLCQVIELDKPKDWENRGGHGLKTKGQLKFTICTPRRIKEETENVGKEPKTGQQLKTLVTGVIMSGNGLLQVLRTH